MPSYVTPKINTAFVFYISLEDAANPGKFKASPTLAAGDVLVATGDGAPSNIATLPVVDADFTKRVKVSLSAGEMNGDNVTVLFSDAAGAEWFDLEINLQTTARQIDDLATQTSVDDVPTVAEMNSRTLLAADYTVVSDLPASAPNVGAIGAEIWAGTYTRQINSVSGSIGGDVEGKVLGGGSGVFVGDGAQVAASGGGATADELWDEVVDGTYTARQLLRLLASALAAKSSGGGTTVVTFRDVADTKDRIIATVDANGNRTAITLTAT